MLNSSCISHVKYSKLFLILRRVFDHIIEIEMFQIDMSEVQAPKDIIVDCDAGIDDALALVLFLPHHKAKKINIKAITCVNGNTGVNNVVKNVFRTLQVCEVSDVSIYCSFILFIQKLEFVRENLILLN